MYANCVLLQRSIREVKFEHQSLDHLVNGLARLADLSLTLATNRASADGLGHNPSVLRFASLVAVLYDLSVSYLLLYNKTVMVISGSLEKRQRCGKIMINTSEIERILLRVFLYPLDFRFQGLQVHSPNQIFKIWNFDVVSQLELHTVH